MSAQKHGIRKGERGHLWMLGAQIVNAAFAHPLELLSRPRQHVAEANQQVVQRRWCQALVARARRGGNVGASAWRCHLDGAPWARAAGPLVRAATC